MIEVPAPINAIVAEIKVKEGKNVQASQLLALLKEADLSESPDKEGIREKGEIKEVKQQGNKKEQEKLRLAEEGLSPAVRRLVAEKEIDAPLRRPTTINDRD